MGNKGEMLFLIIEFEAVVRTDSDTRGDQDVQY